MRSTRLAGVGWRGCRRDSCSLELAGVRGDDGSHNPLVPGSSPPTCIRVPATGSPDSCRLQRCRILAVHTLWRSEMAQRTVVRLTDDLSGAEIAAGKGETVTFSLDGQSYEIDLTAKNASVLRKALRPYIEAGRPIKTSRRRPTRT